MNSRTLTTALTMLGIAACSGSEAPGHAANQSAAQPAEHEHHAPHGGQLIELGDEFAHVELVLDRDSGTLSAYVLDGEAENPTRIHQPSLELIVEGPGTLAVQALSLAAHVNILTGETVGNSSEFVLVSDALRDATALKGRISTILVRGETFKDIPFKMG